MGDFVSEELIEFEIENRKFKYKPVTAGDELAWAGECIKVEEGQTIRDIKQTTLCKIRNIKEAPYSKEDIKNAIGVEKEFKDLTDKEKDLLWSKAKSTLLNEIIIKIQEIESGNSELKKN